LSQWVLITRQKQYNGENDDKLWGQGKKEFVAIVTDSEAPAIATNEAFKGYLTETRLLKGLEHLEKLEKSFEVNALYLKEKLEWKEKMKK
jgi:hypothetical protein